METPQSKIDEVLKRGSRQTKREPAVEVILSEPQSSVAVIQRDPWELITHAIDGGHLSTDALEKLLDLKRQYDADVAKRAYTEAMAAAKQELPAIIAKTKQVDFPGKNGRVHYRHAELGNICQAVVPILAKYGFSHDWVVRQPDSRAISVTCRMTHALGHTESCTMQGPHDDSGSKNGLQAIGSSRTYLHRYTLESLLGIAEGQDDDGQGATQRRDVKLASIDLRQEIARLAQRVGGEAPQWCEERLAENNLTSREAEKIVQRLKARLSREPGEES